MSSVNKCNKALNQILTNNNNNNNNFNVQRPPKLKDSNWIQKFDEGSTTSGFANSSDNSEITEGSVSAVMDELIDYEKLRGPSVLVHIKI